MTDLKKRISDIIKKIKEKGSREARISGNPNESDIDRELSKHGDKRQADDIPKQDVKARRGIIRKGNVSSGFQSSTVETGGVYKIGPAIRPFIRYDAGFSKFPKKDPALKDYWDLLKWTAMLEGADTLRPDLVDGVAAYQHFLHGEGKARVFSYHRYVMNDKSGKLTLRNAILDAQDAAVKLWQDSGQPKAFNFTGPAIFCGSTNPKNPYNNAAFPYPATENWEKGIGAHVIWLSGKVKVVNPPGRVVTPTFTMDFVLHAEDQYNFNPGMQDIASGIPDDANGRFVVVGFAHGYRHTSSLRKTFSWKGSSLGVAKIGYSLPQRHKKPSTNYR